MLQSKCVYDKLLNRDVQSVFDPTTMNHKYSEREKEIIDHDEYGDFIENCRNFIKRFFKDNYSMIYTDYDFEKNLIKKVTK